VIGGAFASPPDFDRHGPRQQRFERLPARRSPCFRLSKEIGRKLDRCAHKNIKTYPLPYRQDSSCPMAAAAMLEATKGFRRLKGKADMPKLVAALRDRISNLDWVVERPSRMSREREHGL